MWTAAVCALAGCSRGADDDIAEARSPIAGGALDEHDDGVVGVVLTDEAGFPQRSCTGTLIAPNLVLTAPHCVADTPSRVDCARSVFRSPVPADRLRVTASPAIDRKSVG